MVMKNKMLKRSHLSEKTCRDIIQLFCDDLTATQIAAITGVSRVTINNYLKLIRTHIARHCEDLRSARVGATGSGRRTLFSVKEDGGIQPAFYGFYVENESLYTDELADLSRQEIREFQQAAWLPSGEGPLHRYAAIADFNDWRLYRRDTVPGRQPQDGITIFWGNTRNRLLKFRGMNKNTLYLHVKESEFRYNYRAEDINQLLLNIIYQYPLHLSKRV